VSVVTAPLSDVLKLTPRSRLLAFDVRNRPFAFQAGQAIIVGAHDTAERRPYSIASSPHRTLETGQLEVLVSVDERGLVGSHLPQLRHGMLVDIEGPVGTFVLPDGPMPDHVLFVAGGTGIAPLRAMTDHLLRTRPECRVSVLYSARAHDEFAFVDEFRGYASGHHFELHQTVTRDEGATWIGGRGRIGQAHFEAVLHEPESTLCFVCGPPALVSESVTTLQLLGVPSELIRTEAWLRRASEPG
jgi:NAD(P)H-flavin reductase